MLHIKSNLYHEINVNIKVGYFLKKFMSLGVQNGRVKFEMIVNRKFPPLCAAIKTDIEDDTQTPEDTISLMFLAITLWAI